MRHLNLEELGQNIGHILLSPKDGGTLEMIVRRPDIDTREELTEGILDEKLGLTGDSWAARGSKMTSDGSAHPEMQINIMNSRCIEVLSGGRDGWKWAGDQLFIDMDLSESNLPPGTKLGIGEAIIEITAIPHTGCKKFAQRYGKDAVRFVNSELGKKMHLRGLNAKVVKGGIIRQGEAVNIIH